MSAILFPRRFLPALLFSLLGCLPALSAQPDELFVLLTIDSYELIPGGGGFPDFYGFRYTEYAGRSPNGTSLYSSSSSKNSAETTASEMQAFVNWASGKLIYCDNYMVEDAPTAAGVARWLKVNGFKVQGTPYQLPFGPKSGSATNFYEVVPLNTPEPPKLTIKFLAHPASYTRLDVSDASLITLKLTSTATPASVEYRFQNADDVVSAYPQAWQPLTQRTANEWELRLPILPLGVTKIEARARGADGTLSPIATTSVTYTQPSLVRGPVVKSVLKPVFDGSRNPAPALNTTALTGSITFGIYWTQLLGGEYAIDSREPGRALWVAQGLEPQGEWAFIQGIHAFWRVKGALSTSFLKALGSGVPLDAGEVYMSDLWMDTLDVQQNGSFLLSYKFSLAVRPTTAAGAALATVPLTLVVKYAAVRTAQHYLPYPGETYADMQYPRTLPEPASVVGAWIIRNDTTHDLSPDWTVPGANSTAQSRLRTAFTGLDHFVDGSAAKASNYAVKPIGSASVGGLLWSGVRETYYLAGDDFSHRYREARWADDIVIRKSTVDFSFSLWGVVDKADAQSFAAVIASTPGTKPPAGADVTPPTLTLAAPKKGLRAAPGTSTPLQGTAKDNVGVTGLEWRWDNESTWHNVAVTAAAVVDVNTMITTPATGLHTLYARAGDAAGNRSVTVVVPVTIAEADVTVTLTIEGQGKVTGLKTGENVLPGALPRTVSASPAAGWSFSHWSVNGASVSEELTWTLVPGAGTAQVGAVFVHQSFAGLAGVYRGVDQTGDAPVVVNLTVAANGVCTGSYKEDGIITRFVKTFPAKQEIHVAVTAGDLSPKTIAVSFTPLEYLSPGDDPGLSGGVFYMNGANYLGSFNLMRSDAGRRVNYQTTAGIYVGTMGIGSSSGGSTGPSGWLRTVVASNGTATTTGKLPDCSPLAMSGPLWRAGNGPDSHVYLPLLQTLPSGAGSFDLLLDLNVISLPDEVYLGGSGRWWHRGFLIATGNSDAPEPMGADLRRYVPPGKNEPLFTAGGTKTLLLQTYFPGYEDGDGYGNSYSGAFTLSSSNQDAQIEGNPKGWKLVFNPAAGTFSGTFVEARGGAARNFTGIIGRGWGGSGLYLHPTLGPCPVSVDAN